MSTSVQTPLRKISIKFFFSHKLFIFFLCAFIGAIMWNMTPPFGITDNGWKVLSVFAFTLLSMILKPFSIGMTTLMSLGVLIVSRTLTFSEAFAGFTVEVVWLIVFAFFIARGFIKTGLGLRISYLLMSKFGSSPLGMAYSLGLTDFLLAAAIPSVTARAGGVIFPVVSSLSKAFDSEPHHNPRKIGAYLMKVVFQFSGITSAMFLTGMAGNAMIQSIAGQNGIQLTWMNWFVAAIVPGLMSLILLPLVIFWFYPPQMKRAPEAPEFAKQKLAELGKMKTAEWLMIGVFTLMITLWILAPVLHISPTLVALMGLMIILGSNVLTWDEVLKEKSAWDTLIWFSALLVLAGSLTKFGVMAVISKHVTTMVGGYSPTVAMLIVAVIYFYAHYFFASNVAHISAMYAPFLMVCISMGAPPFLSAMILAFFSGLFGCLTTYGAGPAPIYFGSGYISTKEWWKLGFIVSLFHIGVWCTVGALWWKFIGLY